MLSTQEKIDLLIKNSFAATPTELMNCLKKQKVNGIS